MSIFVDPAVWPWRDDHWAHLISDVGEAELHQFAERLNLRRLSFQGDHYDVRVAKREQALALGAAAISSRELVSRLRASGLRHRNKVEPWSRPVTREGLTVMAAETVFGDVVSVAMTELLQSMASAGPVPGAPVASLFVRSTEIVVMVEGLDEHRASTMSWSERHTTVAADGTWTVELRE